jgi:hypothetical protein
VQELALVVIALVVFFAAGRSRPQPAPLSRLEAERTDRHHALHQAQHPSKTRRPGVLACQAVL